MIIIIPMKDASLFIYYCVQGHSCPNMLVPVYLQPHGPAVLLRLSNAMLYFGIPWHMLCLARPQLFLHD